MKCTKSSRIQLGISCSLLIKICSKKWGIFCNGKGILQSLPVQNWETVSEILEPSGTPAMIDKEGVEHHLSCQKLIKVPIPTVQEVCSIIVS